jgi:hypothetical protein
MAHGLVAEALKIGRDGGHRTIGNWVDGTDASQMARAVMAMMPLK